MRVNGKKIKELRGSRKIEELCVAADLGWRRMMQIEATESANVNMNVAKAIAADLNVSLDKIAAKGK